MTATTPGKVSLALLLIPFGLIGVVLFELSYVAANLARPTPSLVLHRILPASFSLGVVTLLLLQSLNQLTWKDGLILFMLSLLFLVYLWRADFLSK